MQDNQKPEDSVEDKNISKPQQNKDQKGWIYIFLLFAVLDVFIILISLTMQHTALSAFETLIKKVDRLSEQQDWIARLRNAEINLNSHGNDVFESRDVPLERSAYKVSLKEIEALLTKNEQYKINVDLFRAKLKQMNDAENSIFGLLDESIQPELKPNAREKKATATMAVMDRYQAECMGLLGEMDADLRDQGNKLLEEQHRVLSWRRIAEWIFALFAFLAVARILFFGKQLHSHYEAHMKAEMNRSTQLNETLDELRKTQTQLVQSGKLNAVGELAAGVAHEINNPLSAILTFSVILNNKCNAIPEKDRTPFIQNISIPLERIKKASLRCKNISDNLLSFSRQTEGERVKVEIQKILDSTFELIGVQLRHKKIKLNLGHPENIPSLMANSSQLQQVFTNIVMNAVQAMDENGTLSVSTSVEDSMCRVSFNDTGSGIPEENMTKLFDPFFTTKPIGQGTGLGLSIVYGIIQNHGGKVTAESNLGQGSTFHVSIPLYSTKSRFS